MRNGLKLLFLTLPIVAVGAGYLVWTLQTKSPPVQVDISARAFPVRVVAATEAAIAPVVIGYGLVAPAETFEAIAQVSGIVEWVNPELDRGAFLPAGAELLRLADDDFTLAVAQAEANIRAAEAKLAELVVSQSNQQAALEIERDVLALKATDLDRAEVLLEGGTRAQSAVDTARTALFAQRQKVQSIESTLALIPSQRAGLEANIMNSRAARDLARLNLDRTILTLPFAARVAQVSVEEGRFLRSGEVAAMLDGTAQAEVAAQVPVAELRRLLRASAPDATAYAADPTAMTALLQKLELDAEVRLDLGDEVLTWPGRVDRVSDTIDPKTGTLGVIVVVDEAYARATMGERPPLTKGMFVEVAISGLPVVGLAVPRSALRDADLMISDSHDKLERRSVQVGLEQDDIALITDGLRPGEAVVVSDLIVPVPGMLLAPEIDEALTAALEAAR